MEPLTRPLLGWCDPSQSHYWELEEPSHRCPGKLGNIICGCSCHGGGPEKRSPELRTPKGRIIRRK